MCGGTPSENVVVGKPRRRPRDRFPLTEVKRLAGIDVPLRDEAHPRHLGFMVAGSGPVVKVRCRRGAPMCTARPTSSRRSCASSASTRCR
jgi:hypothetical protein